MLTRATILKLRDKARRLQLSNVLMRSPEDEAETFGRLVEAHVLKAAARFLPAKLGYVLQSDISKAGREAQKVAQKGKQ